MPKAEMRGKYAGVKIHLSDEECQRLLDWRIGLKNGKASPTFSILFTKEIEKSIRNLQAEHPDLLEERTEEQVREALLRDQKKIQEQLSTMKSGQDWKKVK